MSIESSSFRDPNNPYIPPSTDKDKEPVSSTPKSTPPPNTPAIKSEEITPEFRKIFLTARSNREKELNQKLTHGEPDHPINSIPSEIKSAAAQKKILPIKENEKNKDPQNVEGEPDLVSHPDNPKLADNINKEAPEQLPPLVKDGQEPKYVEGQPGLLEQNNPKIAKVIDSEAAKTPIASEVPIDDEAELQKELDKMALEDAKKLAALEASKKQISTS